MDTAKCTLNGELYTASLFSTLPPNELAHKRKHLICPECQADVYFRKASRNGQSACFVCRTHAIDCSLSSSETQGLESGKVDEEIVHNLNQSFELDINVEITPTTLPTPSENKTHVTLSQLLRNLVNSPEFRKSDKKIVIEDPNTTRNVDNFFVHFYDVNNTNNEDVYGFWGILSDARLDSNGSLWLNAGGIGEVSCVIPCELVDDFYKHYKLEDEEELSGAYTLIIGTKKTSANGKDYIKLKNINHIVIRKISLLSELKNKYFINDKKRLAFLLINHQKGIFDDELGIKKKHYIDRKAAKEWKIKLLKELHSDKNQEDSSLDYDEVSSYINKIYNRMVGKA